MADDPIVPHEVDITVDVKIKTSPPVPYVNDGTPMVRSAFEEAIANERSWGSGALAYTLDDAPIADAIVRAQAMAGYVNAEDEVLMVAYPRNPTVMEGIIGIDPDELLRTYGAWGPDELLQTYGAWAAPVEGADLDRLAATIAFLRLGGESDQNLRRRLLGNLRQEAKRMNFGLPGGMRLGYPGASDRPTAWERSDKCHYRPWSKDGASSRGGKIRLRGKRLGRGQLGELSARYAPSARREGVPNRHCAARWLRHAAAYFAVADDALLEGNRARAAQVLTEVVSLQDAVRLTAESFVPSLSRRPRRLSDYVNIEIAPNSVAAFGASGTIEVGDAVSVGSDGLVRRVGSGDAEQVVGTALGPAEAGGIISVRLD